MPILDQLCVLLQSIGPEFHKLLAVAEEDRSRSFLIIGIVARIEYLNPHLPILVQMLGSNSIPGCASAKVYGNDMGDRVVLLE